MKTDKIFPQGGVALAPMAGYTDSAFRSICRRFGASYTVTEMVSAKALVMGNENTFSLLKKFDNDDCAVQLFGHEPDVMANSIQLDSLADFCAYDVNMGCPVRKIVSNGDGSALMHNPKLAGEIVSAMKKATDKPVTAKFRLGVADSNGVVDFAKRIADSGADLITVHFRTREQMYSGKADYSMLEKIVSAVNIPVVANGDVCCKEQYDELISRGAYGVAIGRGALGNPFVFAEILQKKVDVDLFSVVEEHFKLETEVKPFKVVNNEMKKHVAFYLKGKRGNKKVIEKVMKASNILQQLLIIKAFLEGKC